jgi:hypothetical protein
MCLRCEAVTTHADLPAWNAKTARPTDVGTHFWLPVAMRHKKMSGGYRVVCGTDKSAKHGVNKRRACEATGCGQPTVSSDPRCPKHGGKKQASAHRAQNAHRKAKRDAQQAALQALYDKGYPPAPRARDAEVGVVYAKLNPANGQKPMLCKVTGNRKGYAALCECGSGLIRADCTCKGRYHRKNTCELCGEKKLSTKAQRQGVRYCATCQPDAVKAASTEITFFDEYLPLITHADGTPFPCDQRDDRKGGFGTAKNKRKRDCDTTTVRFPDCLHLLRPGANARIEMALVTECDEHSHGKSNYTGSCEAGKIDDQFQAIQDKAAKEGAPRGSKGRSDAEMIPVIFLKVNPDACDVKPAIKVETRVRMAAKLANHYLQMDAAARAALPTDRPIVHCLYYHSKQGKHILDYFDANATDKWDWRGNSCPRA